MSATIKEIEQPATPASTAGYTAAPIGFNSYLLREKNVPVAELFLNSYELNATKGFNQLRKIESIGAFVPDSIPLWRGAVGAALVAARPAHPEALDGSP